MVQISDDTNIGYLVVILILECIFWYLIIRLMFGHAQKQNM